MSKVLVDRELLENCCDAAKDAYAASLLKELEAILDKPAEAEGVVFGFDDRSVKVSQEAYSIFLERERHHLAALSAVTAERDRLLVDLERAHRATNSECMDWAREYERRKEVQAERDQLRDERDARLRQVDTLTEWYSNSLDVINDIAAALPGTQYMDPPDGGDVSVPEQIRRMARDAERYRWLRGRLPGSAYRIAGVIYSEGGDGVDAAVDAAMAAKEA